MLGAKATLLAVHGGPEVEVLVPQQRALAISLRGIRDERRVSGDRAASAEGAFETRRVVDGEDGATKVRTQALRTAVQPCECPPRRRMGAGELKTITTVSSIRAALTRPPNERYSLETPSRSTIRMTPHAKVSSIGRAVCAVSSRRCPRPEAVIQYSTRSGS
jgi:hypothetical protein